MDIFGTAVTITGLTKDLAIYCIQVAHAPESAKVLHNEMAVLSSVIDLFQDIMQQESACTWDQIAPRFKPSEQEILISFDKTVREIEARVAATKVQGIMRVLWPLTEGENKELLCRIDRYKQTLTLILQGELRYIIYASGS